MFSFLKKKTKIEKLQKKFENTMAEWHKLSSTNRFESDKKYAEAQSIIKEMESL